MRRREAERAGVLARASASSASRQTVSCARASNGTSLVAIAAAAADIGRGKDSDNNDDDDDDDDLFRTSASLIANDGLLSEAEVTSHLLTLVRGDESKMAGSSSRPTRFFETSASTRLYSSPSLFKRQRLAAVQATRTFQFMRTRFFLREKKKKNREKK